MTFPANDGLPTDCAEHLPLIPITHRPHRPATLLCDAANPLARADQGSVKALCQFWLSMDEFNRLLSSTQHCERIKAICVHLLVCLKTKHPYVTVHMYKTSHKDAISQIRRFKNRLSFENKARPAAFCSSTTIR